MAVFLESFPGDTARMVESGGVRVVVGGKVVVVPDHEVRKIVGPALVAAPKTNAFKNGDVVRAPQAQALLPGSDPVLLLRRGGCWYSMGVNSLIGANGPIQDAQVAAWIDACRAWAVDISRPGV